jgi:DNA polymerase-3 subunit gamma/tau
MSYLAMARKWRPETFNDLVGQDHIATTIANALDGGRLHHAFLFTGTRGVGKTTAARILAKSINCSEPGSTPCGKCSNCIEITRGSSMDVIEIDGASNNSVDDVRDLIEQVKYAPMSSKYKVFIIDEVHMLSKSAFNALLKTLEEPPPHVIFIFATTEVEKVPPTILSRIQRYDFRRLGPSHIRNRLSYISGQESITASDEALAMIAELADGSMRDALTLYDQVYSFAGKEMSTEATRTVLGVPPDDLYYTLIQSLYEHDPKKCFLVISQFLEMGIEISTFLEGFSKFLRNLLFISIDGLGEDELELSSETVLKLKEASKDFESGDILRFSRILADLQLSLKNAPQPRITVEMAFARMAWLDRVKDLRKYLSGVPVASSETLKKKA